jgi:DNA-binding beta-propeller fold protein YncE
MGLFWALYAIFRGLVFSIPLFVVLFAVLLPVPKDGYPFPSRVRALSSSRVIRNHFRRAQQISPGAILRRVAISQIYGEIMKSVVLTLLFLVAAGLLPLHLVVSMPAPLDAHGFLFVANQGDHTALVVDLATRKVLNKIGVDINGHEVAVAPNHHFGYVPIYGNSGVGKPGTDGSSIHVIDLREGRDIQIINLGKPVRPHCAKFGPDGMLYVSAELADAIYVVDAATGKVVGEVPTGAAESHMFVLSPDGHRAYTANVGPGSVSVLDLQNRSLVTVIPIAKTVQRISISTDGRYVFTQDQDSPRIAVIDTATNKLARWIDLPAKVYSSTPTPDGRLLIANAPSGKLFVIDLSTEKVTGEYAIPAAIGEIAVDAASDHAYITCPQKGTLEFLDLRGSKLEPPMILTPGVDGVAWFPAIS